MTEVRLLTFNALFKGDVRPRLRALGEILEQHPYDVVCLQEVMFRGNAKLIRRGFGHHAYGGGVLLRGGLVLLSRWPIRTARFVQYPRVGPVRGEYLMRKGAQLVELDTPGGPLTVVNTHLSANRDGDWSPANRYSAVARAELSCLASLLDGIDPVVATGDFNLPRDSVVLADFLAATGLTDVMAGDTEPTYRPTPQWPSPPAFDHVLTRSMSGRARLVFRDAVPLSGGRAGYLSDHYGVETVLTRR